jgi:hypothetical protein
MSGIFDMVVEQLSNKDRTESITFRLPKKILEQIEIEARQNNTSENVLVRQILTNYVDWFRVTDGIGMIPMTKESLQKITQNLEGSSIHDIVESINSLIRSVGLIKYGKYDLVAAVESLSVYVQMSNHKMVHVKEGHSHRFLIQHNFGMAWSLILEQLLRAVFGEFIDNSQIRFKTTDDSIIAAMNLDL